MLRIVDESRLGEKLSPEQLLAACHEGRPLTAYLGKQGSQFRVKAWDLGNGHLEVTASRLTEWHEAEWDAVAIEGHLDALVRDREEPHGARNGRSGSYARPLAWIPCSR